MQFGVPKHPLFHEIDPKLGLCRREKGLPVVIYRIPELAVPSIDFLGIS